MRHGTEDSYLQRPSLCNCKKTNSYGPITHYCDAEQKDACAYQSPVGSQNTISHCIAYFVYISKFINDWGSRVNLFWGDTVQDDMYIVWNHYIPRMNNKLRHTTSFRCKTFVQNSHVSRSGEWFRRQAYLRQRVILYEVSCVASQTVMPKEGWTN